MMLLTSRRPCPAAGDADARRDQRQRVQERADRSDPVQGGTLRAGFGGGSRWSVHPSLCGFVGNSRPTRRPVRQTPSDHHRKNSRAGADGACRGRVPARQYTVAVRGAGRAGRTGNVFRPVEIRNTATAFGRARACRRQRLGRSGHLLGILAGTIAGPLLFGLDHGAAIVSVAGLAVAVAGVGSAIFVPSAPSSVPGLHVGWNLARETAALLRTARANKRLALHSRAELVLGARPPRWSPSCRSWSVTGWCRTPTFSHCCSPYFRSASARDRSAAHGCCAVRLHRAWCRSLPWDCRFSYGDFGRQAGNAHALNSAAAFLHSPTGWRLLAICSCWQPAAAFTRSRFTQSSRNFRTAPGFPA